MVSCVRAWKQNCNILADHDDDDEAKKKCASYNIVEASAKEKRNVAATKDWHFRLSPFSFSRVAGLFFFFYPFATRADRLSMYVCELGTGPDTFDKALSFSIAAGQLFNLILPGRNKEYKSRVEPCGAFSRVAIELIHLFLILVLIVLLFVGDIL